MTYVVLFLLVAWLAYGNGANDNFKGVATLYGSGAATFRQALAWATIATAAGSVLSIILADRLVSVFSGAGLLSPELLGAGTVLATIAAAAAVTITLATLLGMPTSTTHALAGALLGIAWTTSPSSAVIGKFFALFAVPLLVSPLIAILLTVSLYPLLRRTRLRMGITHESCVCVDDSTPETGYSHIRPALAEASAPALRLGTSQICRERYDGKISGIDAESGVKAVHFVSAGAVCFSRAVNDTPKIAALLLALHGQNTMVALAVVAGAMAAGGLIQARRVAETMSHRITDLNPGQGLCANLVTAALVLFASRLGVPVSTTHVSCGAIFGIGLTQRQARWRTVTAVAGTWVATLPLAAVVAASLHKLAVVVA